MGNSTPLFCTARLIVLYKEPSGRFALKHRLSLPETARYLEVTFAVFPNGNALCGVHEFVQLYELESSESNSAATAFTLKAHQLPGVNNCAYRNICGFRIGSGWRLAIAFDDNSVRAFAMIGGTLSEVCRLPSLPIGLQPHEILAVRPGVLCVHCEKQNPDNSWTSIFDYVDFAPLGYFHTTRRLLECKTGVFPITTLQMTDVTLHSRVTLVALDAVTKSLQFYAFTELTN